MAVMPWWRLWRGGQAVFHCYTLMWMLILFNGSATFLIILHSKYKHNNIIIDYTDLIILMYNLLKFLLYKSVLAS